MFGCCKELHDYKVLALHNHNPWRKGEHINLKMFTRIISCATYLIVMALRNYNIMYIAV